ncbi:MAG: hypothetical protein HY704_14265 [Gemmatimonadetes bacterium]|nr:hypothetical protein [Gemmatimonadota bacterium]
MLAALIAAPAPVRGQPATVTEAGEFRAETNGPILATIAAGSAMVVESVRPPWVQVRLEGWVWAPSLEAREGGAFDLVVAASAGENLRSEPNGRVLARLARGTLLEEQQRRPGWVRVRRLGWMRASAVAQGSGAAVGRQEAAVAPQDPIARGGDWLRVGRRGGAILSAPDGDTLALAVAGRELRVLARQGNWARVRVEGWTWVPKVSAEEAADTAILADVAPRDLVAAPAEYRGRLVSWRLQFISLERAEKVRTDFYEGEPFVLARTAEPEARFVYVAVPPERLADVERLAPLEWILVVGRVRTGAAALTGSPILDLLELRRGRRPGTPDDPASAGFP